MSKKIVLLGLILLSNAVFAADQTLNCNVTDTRQHSTKPVVSSSAILEIHEGKTGAISQIALTEGVFACQVSYSLIDSNRFLSIKLFRKDMVVAQNVDLAFTNRKVVNSYVQQLDLSKANNALWTTGEAFGAGICKCTSVASASSTP